MKLTETEKQLNDLIDDWLWLVRAADDASVLLNKCKDFPMSRDMKEEIDRVNERIRIVIASPPNITPAQASR